MEKLYFKEVKNNITQQIVLVEATFLII